jgi:F-type H+-transporting ATPase subunit a
MIDWLFIGAAQAAETAHAPAVKHGGPMEQFVIDRYIHISLFGYDASFTNSSLWMVFAVLVVSGFLIWAMRGGSMIPTRVQSVAEVSYEFVANMVRQNAGDDGMKYFPVIFTIFVFIFALNMLGMIPLPGLGNFTVTSHIIVTFALALFVFLGVTLIGIVKNGFHFLRLFAPSGVPVALLPLIAPIEVISYFVRPMSLSVRLFANMMAGHTMLAVFGGFVVGLGILGGWVPLLFMVLIVALETLIAFLQAYVFAVLSCIYLADALHAADH